MGVEDIKANPAFDTGFPIDALTAREAFQSAVVASEYSLIWAGSLVQALNARDNHDQYG